MKNEDLLKYDGKVVIFLHKLAERDSVASRWSRGIVYKGTCYDLPAYNNGFFLHTIPLETIKTEYIEKIETLGKKQQSAWEQSIARSLNRGNLETVTFKIPIRFEPWREDKEKEKDKNSTKPTHHLPETQGLFFFK